MAAPPRELPRLKRLRRRLSVWADGDRYALAKLLAGITVLSLALRFVALGDRVAHYDEGRVAYWALNYAETGSFTYRYIIHGPFIQHVDSWLFALVGTNDVIMRLPIAVVGGLLPLTALLFRAHLSRSEVVGVAAFLALNPLVLYYSRFMRSDVLVAAFMFTAFGLLVRFYDTRRARYLYGVGFFAALGFASKENAIVYVVTWLGATGLLVGKLLVLPNGYREAGTFVRNRPSLSAVRNRIVGRLRADVALVVGTVRSFRDRHDSPWMVLGGYTGHVVGALLVFFAVSLFFYAPRGAGLAGIQHPPATPTADTVNFWNGVTNPAMFPDLVGATYDRVITQYSNWFNPASERATTGGEGLRAAFETFFEEVDGHYAILLEALAYTCGPLLAFSLFGYALDRLGSVEPRHIVPFAAYCGYVSIVGYPIGTDIGNAWIGVHVVVPLAIPAGVGVATVFRWGVESLSADDVTGVAVSGLVLVLLVALVGNVAATNVYSNSHVDGNPLVQYAQPQESLRADLTAMDRIAADHTDGPDLVVYYGASGDDYDSGSAFVQENSDEWGEAFWNLRPTCLRWYTTLPLPWYLASSEIETACENDPAALSQMAADGDPPIIITQPFDDTYPGEALRDAGYENEGHQLRTGGYKTTFTVWIHESYADERPSSRANA